MTINYTTTEVQRMSHAYGIWLNIGRDATEEEVRQATMAWQKNVVFQTEHQTSVDSAVSGVPPPDPFSPT